MEAKDTVMTQKEIDTIPVFTDELKGKTTEGVVTISLARVAKAQAEISFKAGRREVVEWVNDNLWRLSHAFKQDWQTKLKEWGMA